MSILEIKDLRVHYGKAEALKGISMSLEVGCIVTLIGANGAGKTTTLRTISGLKMPTSGEIWYQGTRIDGLPPHEILKKGIAHVPEGRMVFSSLSVMENLRMGAYTIKDKQKVAKNLEMVFEHFPVLNKRRHQIAATLSGGEQQMLAVARALMSSPKVMLMDEPSIGLSPILVEEVGRIITQINQSGVSIILVEQNARMALELASTAYVLEVGEVTLQGSAKKLSTEESVVKAFLGV